MESQSIGSRLKAGGRTYLLIGLLALGVLLTMPGHSFTHDHGGNHHQRGGQNPMMMMMGGTGTSMFANNPIMTFIMFESIVGASLMPNDMLNQGQVNFLLFEFAVDMFLAGQVADAELIQLMQFEASINRQMGI
jgi:hypothetical protein